MVLVHVAKRSFKVAAPEWLTRGPLKVECNFTAHQAGRGRHGTGRDDFVCERRQLSGQNNGAQFPAEFSSLRPRGNDTRESLFFLR
jgi:hypothetical protein